MRFDAASGKWCYVLCGAASVVIGEIISNTAFHLKRWSGCGQIFLADFIIVFKLLVPMLLLMVIVAVVMFDGLKQSHQPRLQDLAVFVYAMLFALFGFVAVWRSHFKLAFFWIPNGKGKTNIPLYLHPRELRKIEDGDARAIR